MSEQTTLAANETAPEKPRRGNPNWVKKPAAPEGVVRAEMESESGPTDIWTVGDKDPNLHYVWARKDRDEELSMMAHKGYAPARGKEKILGNPFESKTDTDGGVKERGNRILMCCPKHMIEARQRERAAQYVNAKKAAEGDARRMSGNTGVLVKPEASTETERKTTEE